MEQTDEASLLIRVYASHEAGHALAMVRYGFAFDHVSILPERNSGGHVTRRQRKARQAYPSRESIRRRVFFLIAGEACERTFFRASDAVHQESGMVDRELAHRELMDFLRMADASKRAGFIDAELRRAMEWFSQPQVSRAVELVVILLLHRKTLKRQDVIHMFQSCITEPPP